MKKPLVLATAVATLLVSHRASATNLYWDGTGTGWESLSSWSTDPATPDVDPLAIPGSGDTAFFNISTVNTAQTINLNANQAALGLVVNSTGAVALQGGNGDRTLSLGTGGITTSAGAGALTIGSATAGQQVALSLQGSQTWINSSGTTSTTAITVNNGVSLGVAGAATLTLSGNTPSSLNNVIAGSISDGAGTLSLTMPATAASGTRWLLTAANTYSGVTTVNGGALRISNNNALGTTASGTVVNAGGGLFLDSVTVTGETLSLTGDGAAGSASGALLGVAGSSRWTGNITVNTGTTTGRIGAINSSTVTIDGTITGTGTGQLVFQTGTVSPNSGTIVVNGNISFPGQRLIKSANGSGTVILNGTNSYSDTTISSGTLQIGNGGTTGNLGTGPVSIAATTSGTLAFKRSDNITVSNVLSGAGAVAHLGTGTLTLNAANNLTGATSVTGGGTLVLDYTGAATSNVAGTGALSLTAAKLNIIGKNTGTSSQTFSGVTIATGKSTISLNSNSGTATNLALNGFARAASPNGVGSVLALMAPAAGGFTTTVTNTNGILAGYVTMGSSWAANDGSGNIVPLSTFSSDLTTDNVNLDVSASGTLTANPNTIRFDAAQASTLTLSGTRSVASGGIMVTSNVGTNLSQISGGTLSTGNGLDLIVFQNNTANGLTISSIMANSITKDGDGVLTLTAGSNGNSITTRILAGTISVGNPSPLGSGSGAAVIVFPLSSTGTLQLTGTFSSAKGFTLTGNGIVDVPNVATLTSATSAATGANGVSGGLTKTGAGTLVYSASSNTNSYTGATTINGGAIQVNTLANGGVASGIGQSTSDASNLVLNGGTLIYAGGSASGSTDRLFTVGSGGGGLDGSGASGNAMVFTNPGLVGLTGSNTARTFTLKGTNTDANTFTPSLGDNGSGATSLVKSGAGAWVLAGTNTYSGGTTVSAGSLTAAANGALGLGNVTVQTIAASFTIQTGVLDAIANTASFSLAGDGVLDNAAASGYAFLSAGVNESVGALILGGVAQTDFGGTYGATGSGATHIFDDYFKGTGVVTLVPEPGSATVLLSVMGIMAGLGRFRRCRVVG